MDAVSETTRNGEAAERPAKDNLDDAELNRRVEASRQARVKQCGVELQALLEKHGCALQSYQEIVNGMPSGPARILIVATR